MKYLLLCATILLSSCTMARIKTGGTTIKYGQFFQHKQLTYNTDATGKTTFTYSTQPKGQEELIRAVIAAYHAGMVAEGM
jgi:hypothetical protein